MLEVRDLSVVFKRRDGSPFHALDGVSISVRDGEIVGIAGESGSGKTTLVRAICGLQRPTSGQILLDGRPIGAGRPARGKSGGIPISMVFQDAVGALDPRQTAGDAVAEALRVHGAVPRGMVAGEAASLMRRVGLPADVAGKRPGQMSGGQCQRVCIARALAPRPSILIGDEPVSALDVSVQARILKLFASLLSDSSNGLRAILVITHDLAVVSSLCDRVYIMERGKVVESGAPSEVFARPSHPYTRRLLDAASNAELFEELPLGENRNP